MIVSIINISTPLLLGSIKCFSVLALVINILSNDTVNFISTYDSYIGTTIGELSYWNFTHWNDSIKTLVDGEVFFKITTQTSSNVSFSMAYSCNQKIDSNGLIWILISASMLCIFIGIYNLNKYCYKIKCRNRNRQYEDYVSI
jgi:hypothetical protein